MNVADVRRRDAADRIVKVAVQQLRAVERRAVGDAVDRVKDRVDLLLVGADFLGRQPARAGRLADQALNLRQECIDFAQAAVSGADDVVGEVGVGDRRRDAGLIGQQVLRRDQACRIVGAAVDLQTSAQPPQTRIQRRLVVVERVLRDQRLNVGINSAHGTVSP